MILVLDNYDSFTYNLVQYLGEVDPDIQVVRNDVESSGDLLSRGPSHIVISPGPCTPAQAGVSVELIRKTPPTIPLLGVCLGHQAIAAAYGGRVVRSPVLMHGKVSAIRRIAEDPVLAGLPETWTATRYHSLIVERESLPAELVVTAESSDGLIMALRHAERPAFGLQFHPESILTGRGKAILANFLKLKGTA